MWDREDGMSMNKTYAVFGLGRYGRAVAKELSTSGVDVLAVDMDEESVNAVAQDLPFCKCADVTNAEVLKQLDVANIDVVVVAMANSLEASVLTTMLCKEAGVPRVVVKCAEEMQGKILSRVGADKVVFPEKESGIRLAKNLLSSGFSDLIELSQEVSMVETNVKKEWVGKTLSQLNFRKKYSANVVAIRLADRVQVNVDPEQPLKEEMKLIMIAETQKLKKLREK